MFRRLLKLAALVVAIVIVAGLTFVAWRFYDRDPDVSAADVRPTPELVARGEYLVTAADCAACHNIPGAKPFTGGLAFQAALRHDLLDQHHRGRGDRHRDLE